MSHYSPQRRLGVEEVELLLILDLSLRWGGGVNGQSQVPAEL
jgi:hypothetical protein